MELEDGTAVVRVRLSEKITRRLFGVEAREFKKIYQRDEGQASRIQVRCRIRHLEVLSVSVVYTCTFRTGTIIEVGSIDVLFLF